MLGEAIFNDYDLSIQLLRSAPIGWRAVVSEQTSHVHSELDSLCKSGVGIGQYVPESDLEKLDIPATVQQVRQTAPVLWALLCSFMEAKRQSKPRDLDPKYEGYLLMICAILLYGRFPKTPLMIPTLLGLHLHSMGVKRRSINLLSGLGVVASYTTIMARVKEIAARGEVESGNGLQEDLINQTNYKSH
jgi:hypothetical protein